MQHHQPIGSGAHNSSRTTIQETKKKTPQIFLDFFSSWRCNLFRHFRYIIITNQQRSEVSRSFLIASRRPAILISALWKLRQCRAAFTIRNFFFFPYREYHLTNCIDWSFLSSYSSDYRCNLYTLAIRYYIERKRKLPLLFLFVLNLLGTATFGSHYSGPRVCLCHIYRESGSITYYFGLVVVGTRRSYLYTHACRIKLRDPCSDPWNGSLILIWCWLEMRG